MHQAFGGEFQCKVNVKHHMNLYFFDSKPTEHFCPLCDDGTMMERVRVLVMAKNPAGDGLEGARNARKTRLKQQD